ncbi:MAG TPA: hypothetical protein VIE91_07560 [Methylophilaceae bacterium]
MKLKVTHKILIGYLAGFVLLLAFAGLTLFNGKRIEATTIELSQHKLPGLIAVAELKSGLQVQTNHLYALYATNDQAAFEKHRQQDMADMHEEMVGLENLPEYKNYEATLNDMTKRQSELTEKFVQVMRQSEIDWDSARDVLGQFGKGADAMGKELDKLVQAVAKQTIDQATTSQRLTEQLMSVGLVLTVLIFLGVLVMAYFANSTVAQPLRGTSKALSEITIRRDFTSRLKQYSDDEIGDIAVAANNLLQEFQQLALTLDGTAQEVGRATTTLTDVAENARVSMTARNAKLRAATQDFMKDIEAASGDAKHEIDVQLHRAQMKFIQTHLIEIDEGTVANERNVTALQGSITKLSDLSKNMHAQIRLLNF